MGAVAIAREGLSSLGRRESRSAAGRAARHPAPPAGAGTWRPGQDRLRKSRSADLGGSGQTWADRCPICRSS